MNFDYLLLRIEKFDVGHPVVVLVGVHELQIFLQLIDHALAGGRDGGGIIIVVEQASGVEAVVVLPEKRWVSVGGRHG